LYGAAGGIGPRLRFTVPGADVALAGSYTFDEGSDRLPRQAAIAGEGISNHDRLEAMARKPADLFVAKDGHGDATPNPDRRHA
jgi:hypothetical protein